ncbi:MAG: VCBS repeat-containing protein [Polyangiaceae bacterium]|nr:VCBS repeat-containing protein [Polyangiaceae bacterium]
MAVASCALALAGCGEDECEANRTECMSQSRFRTCEYVMSGDPGGSYEWHGEACPSETSVCHEYDSYALCLPENIRMCASKPVLPKEVPLWAASVGDVNSDSIPDVALVLEYEPAPWLAVALGNAQGTFDAPLLVEELELPAISRPRAVVASDLTGDGVSDLALVTVPSSGPSVVRWWGGLGAGKFGSGGQLADEGDSVALIAADLDQDGRAELVSSSIDDGGFAHASVFGVVGGKLVPLAKVAGARGSLAHLAGGRFVVGGSVYEMKSGAVAKVQKLEDDERVSEAHARDIDQDGNVDVVLVDSEWGSSFEIPIRVYMANATGQLALESTLHGGRHLAITDVDRDGFLDLVSTAGDGRVGAHLSSGTLSTELSQAFPNTPPVHELVIASGLPSAFPGGSASGERLVLRAGVMHATLRVMADDCFP